MFFIQKLGNRIFDRGGNLAPATLKNRPQGTMVATVQMSNATKTLLALLQRSLPEARAKDSVP